MSGSRQSKWWELLLHLVPGTTVWCPGYNMHWRWQKVCHCMSGQDGWGLLLYEGRNRWVDLTGHPGVVLGGHEGSSRWLLFRLALRDLTWPIRRRLT